MNDKLQELANNVTFVMLSRIASLLLLAICSWMLTTVQRLEIDVAVLKSYDYRLQQLEQRVYKSDSNTPPVTRASFEQ